MSLAIASPVQAQITSERTLPNHSKVTSDRNTFVITGGTQAGTNLFHSFREFSVPTGGIASFRPVDSSIDRIISRVTGSSISRINGVIEALQANGQVSPADIFLINPNGIVFGPNASLNLGGSFLATTADRLDFADGFQFHANGTQSSPLLTISAPVGIQFGQAPGRIINRSAQPLLDATGTSALNPAGDPLLGLSLPIGQTLALLGGNITLAGGALTVSQGRIELSSLAASRVTLLPSEKGWRFSYSGVRNFGDIRIDQRSLIDATGVGGGTIRLRGDRILIGGQSELLADTSGEQIGNGIFIQANQLRLTDLALVTASTLGSGQGGQIEIQTHQLQAEGGAQIETSTQAEGTAGNLSVNANGSIELTGFGKSNGTVVASGFLTSVYDNAIGRGGNITISTPQLRIAAGGQVNAGTEGRGDSGNIVIRAAEVTLAGVALAPNGEPYLFRGVPAAPSALSAFTNSAGRAGDVQLFTQQLSLRDGAVIQTSTQSQGDAGNILIRARAIAVSGTASHSPFPSGFLTFSGGIPRILGNVGNVNATGRGGTLNLSTQQLSFRDGAVAAAGSLNASNNAAGAGNLRINAQTIQLDNQSRLLTETASRDGGEISLQVRDALVLGRDRNLISATAGVEQQSGNGGNIHINGGSIISSFTANNDIRANAFSGNGGRVEITADAVLGIESRSSSVQDTPLSDITASSEFGVSGTIQLNSPKIDPSRGLIELPADVINVANQIAQTCPSGSGSNQANEFVVTGRGGLPPSASSLRSSETILTNWATLEEKSELLRSRQSSPPATSSAIAAPTPHIPVEAQGWIFGTDRQVRLVAQLQLSAPRHTEVPDTGLCR